MENLKIIIIAMTVALVTGAGAYYFGQTEGYKTGHNSGYTKGYDDGKKAVEAEQQEMISKTTAGAEVNPVENLPSANPLEGVKTNPFEGGYKNPFK